MKVNIDKMGPWVKDDALKAIIEEHGISGTILADEARGFENWWSKDLRVLHVPTGKVNGYSSYYDLQRKVLTMFNGFFQEPLEHPLEEFKYIYHDDIEQKTKKEWFYKGK